MAHAHHSRALQRNTGVPVPIPIPVASGSVDCVILHRRPEPLLEHPLLNNLVLEKVFSFLDVETLKFCRFVCKLWNDVSTPQMLTIGALSVDAQDEEGISGAQRWVSSQPKWFKHFTFKNITHASYQNVRVFLGQFVKAFSVFQWWNDSRDLTLQDFEDIIFSCPNLEELTIPATKNCKYAKKFLIPKKSKDQTPPELKLKKLTLLGDTKPNIRFLQILTYSPNLQNLKVDCGLVPEFWNPMDPTITWSERLSNLRELEIREYANESLTGKTTQHILAKKWKINKLTVELYNLIDEIIKALSNNVRDTMEDFHMILFNRFYPPWPIEKDTFWLVPGLMPWLRILHIEIDDHCYGPILCRCLICAIPLKYLKKLYLTIHEGRQSHIQDWPVGLFTEICSNSLEGDSGEALQSNSLKSLRLPSLFQDLTVITSLNEVFPNLTELILDLPKPEVLQSVFLHGKTLERFSVTLSSIGPIIDWTSILIGSEKHGYQEVDPTDHVQVEDPQLFLSFESIRNLCNLKQLKVEIGADSDYGACTLTIRSLRNLPPSHFPSVSDGPMHIASPPSGFHPLIRTSEGYGSRVETSRPSFNFPSARSTF